MDDTIQTGFDETSALPAAEGNPSSLTSEKFTEESSNCAFSASDQYVETVVNDAAAMMNDVDDDDDDDSEEIRALTSAAASLADSDESSDETAAVFTDSQDGAVCAAAGGPSSPAGDCLAPPPPLSVSSASVIGRIASGFNTAINGGLHPLKRSHRVGPELPSPRRPDSSASSQTARSLSPKEFFWKPVMPGYSTPQSGSDDMRATMVIRQTIQLEQTERSNNDSGADVGLQQAIPIMPMYLAVICCILNVLSPGLGTFIAGLSLGCGSVSRPQRENVDCASLLFVNIWVAIFQLISTFLLLIGWIWSLIWGFSFISISKEFSSKLSEEETGESGRDESGDRQESARGLDSVRTTAMTRTTTTTVSLPDEPAATSTFGSSREPPIIILQEAPVTPNQRGLFDAAAAAVWMERERSMRHEASRPVTSATNSSTGADNRSAQHPMSRRQRINRRRQQAAAAAAAGSAAARPWNDPLTGVLLCPEALEHIVVHSSIVPDHNAVESATHGLAAGSQTHKVVT